MYKVNQLETQISADLAAQLLMLILFLTNANSIPDFFSPN